MAKTTREKEEEARKAKLDHVQKQIDSGDLVVRKMTKAEQAAWEKEQRRRDALATPAERARREAALENRRRRSQRFSTKKK